MTHRRTWQKMETAVARLFGVERRPYSGAARDDDDIEHPTLYVECKLRKAFELITLWLKTAKEADKFNKLPVLVVQKKGDRRPYAVCPLDPEYLEKLAVALRAGERAHGL